MFHYRQHEQTIQCNILYKGYHILDRSSKENNIGCLETTELESCHHISSLKSGEMWLSDYLGNLILIDNSQKICKHIFSSGGYGFHSATEAGTLLLADCLANQITEVQSNYKTTVLFSTGKWSPRCIFSSRLSGDILVGVKSRLGGFVVRYNRKGKELQRILAKANGEKIYLEPIYITENKNGDICTSDWYKEALVVVNKSGLHRFSYNGAKGAPLFPGSVCTDSRGHILLFESSTLSVHRISKNGVLLDIVTQTVGFPFTPQGMCIDEKQHLWVASNDSGLVSVMKCKYCYWRPKECFTVKSFFPCCHSYWDILTCTVYLYKPHLCLSTWSDGFHIGKSKVPHTKIFQQLRGLKKKYPLGNWNII